MLMSVWPLQSNMLHAFVPAAGHGVSGSSSGSAPAEGELSAADLAAELNVGRLVPHWSPLEDLQDMLFNIKPEEIEVGGLGQGEWVGAFSV